MSTDVAETNPPAGLGPWPIAWVAFALGTLVLAVLFFGTLSSMAFTWWNSDTFTHCLLIVPIAAYLIWERGDELAAHAPHPSWLGLPVILGGGLVWLLGDVASVNFVRQFGLIFMWQGLILAIFGLRLVWMFAFPIGYLLFLVPFGEFVQPTLQQQTAEFVVAALGWLNIPVYLEGLFIYVPRPQLVTHPGSGQISALLAFEVAKECSGIRYLIGMFAIGLLTAYLFFEKWWKRIICVAVALLVPIVANWLRAFGIVYIAYSSNGRHGMGLDHLIYGFWFYLLIIVIFLFIASRFMDGLPKKSEAGIEDTQAAAPRSWQLRLAGVLAAGLFTAALAPAYAMVSLARHGEVPADLAMPQQIASWSAVRQSSPNWAPEFENPDWEGLQAYSYGAEPITVYIAYYTHQREGAEAISAGNRLSSEAWRLAARRAAPGGKGVPGDAAEVVITDGTHAKLIWHYYWVNGNRTGSDVMAKLESTLGRLIYGRQEAAFIAIGADMTSTEPRARKALELFLEDFDPVTLLEATNP